MLTSEQPRPDHVRMLERELALLLELDPAWALRPIALGQHQGRAALILEDRPGEPLGLLLATSKRSSERPAMELGMLLRVAVGVAAALNGLHRKGIVHKNLKPTHVLVDTATAQTWLMGFG